MLPEQPWSFDIEFPPDKMSTKKILEQIIILHSDLRFQQDLLGSRKTYFLRECHIHHYWRLIKNSFFCFKACLLSSNDERIPQIIVLETFFAIKFRTSSLRLSRINMTLWLYLSSSPSYLQSSEGCWTNSLKNSGIRIGTGLKSFPDFSEPSGYRLSFQDVVIEFLY